MGSLRDSLKAFELALTFRKAGELMLQKLSPKDEENSSETIFKIEEN
jgi:hypothetical protein